MITLTTDFGLSDPLYCPDEGAIYTLNPNAKIVDITHGVDKFNIYVGAFMLASATSYFPAGTVCILHSRNTSLCVRCDYQNYL